MKLSQSFKRRFASNSLEFVDGFKHRLDGPFFPYHEHDCFEIVYHPQGKGKTTLQHGKELTFEQGGVVLYKPFDRHSQLVTMPALDAVIQFTGRDTPPELDVSRAFRPLRQDWVNRMMLDLSSRAHGMSADERLVQNHRLTAFIVALFTLGESYEDRGDETVRRDHADLIHAFLREQYHNIRRVEEAASAAGISYPHARRLFVRKYGKTIKRALMEIRLDEAKSRLATTPFSMKMIAHLVGLQNESYFSSVFRRFEHMTPSDYRDSLRQGDGRRMHTSVPEAAGVRKASKIG